MRATAARAAAFKTLRDVRRGRFLDVAFARAAADLNPQDRAWARECAFGTLRLRGRFDHVLGRLLHKGLDSVSPAVLDVLRLGLFQMRQMEVPDHAAVAQSVELARAHTGAGSTGLVNGVLRAASRAGDWRALFPDRARDPVGYLTWWHSHPRWLVERWLARWPPEQVEALLRANNRTPHVYLRPLDGGFASAAARLGSGAVVDRLTGTCVRIPNGLTPTEAMERIRSIVQDPAAAAVTEFADIAPGASVADLCAAPGGKAVVLSLSAARLIATDRSRARLARLVETRARLGLRIGIAVALAEAPAVRDMDAVLLDVPCSGTGTLRRHPDLKWRLGPKDVGSLVAEQRRILDGAVAAVAPGGLLVYATCTLEPEENEEQVKGFLSRHPDFAVEPTEAVAGSLRTGDGHLLVLPTLHDGDGAFAARLRRSG